MDHCNDIDLMEFCQGRLDNARTDVVCAHLAQCRSCAERFAELRRVGQMLDTWQPAHSAENPEAVPPSTADGGAARRSRFWPEFGRFAAAIVIGVVIGASSGRYLALSGSGHTQQPQPMTDRVASHLLHIQTLEPGAATGLDAVSGNLLLFAGGPAGQ